MRFKKINSLDEEHLVEATVPTYRDILLNLIAELTEDAELKQILNSDERNNLQFHHIDSIYEEVGLIIKRKKAKNNNPGNIALMYKEAHDELTKINKQYSDPEDKRDNLYKLMKNEDYINKIFPLEMYLPHLIAQSLEKVIPEGVH